CATFAPCCYPTSAASELTSAFTATSPLTAVRNADPQPLRRHPEARQGKLPALRPQGLVQVSGGRQGRGNDSRLAARALFQVSPLRYGFQDPPGTEDAHRGEALRGPLQVLRLSRRLQDGRRLPSALEQETQHQQRLPSSVHIGNVSAEAENRIVRRNGKEWRRHVHPAQQKTRPGPGPGKQGGAFRKKAEQDGRARAKPTGWTCGECLQWFPERDSYVSHVKTAHSKVRGRGSLRLEGVRLEKPKFIFILSVQQSAKKYPCRHCEQSFTSRTGLRRHNRTSHDGKKRAYTCWYCTESKTTFA
ncbi:unnamed protein product, partial [Tetraodon nigroviridis]